MTAKYSFIADLAAHLEGWTLETTAQVFKQTERARLVCDTNPDAAIIAQLPRWEATKWSFHADLPEVARRFHVHIEDRPKAINADCLRGADVVARDVARRLVPAVLQFATDVAERAAVEKERVEASDAAVDQIVQALPGARADHGKYGSVSFFKMTSRWDHVSADFRLDHGSVTLRGLTPDQQVAIAQAFAALVDPQEW